MPRARDGVKTVRVEGKLVLVFPRDIEAREFAVRDGRIDGKEELGGSSIAASGVADADGGWDVRIEWNGGERQSLHSWFEDADGGWIDEAFSFATITMPRTQGSTSGDLRKMPGAAKLVIARYVGEEFVTIPFSIGDVRVPDVPPK